MQQIQFATRVGKNRKQKQTKKRTHVKKNRRFLHNLDRTSEEILRVRVQRFIECRGYLPKTKSL